MSAIEQRESTREGVRVDAARPWGAVDTAATGVAALCLGAALLLLLGRLLPPGPRVLAGVALLLAAALLVVVPAVRHVPRRILKWIAPAVEVTAGIVLLVASVGPSPRERVIGVLLVALGVATAAVRALTARRGARRRAEAAEREAAEQRILGLDQSA